MSKPVVDSGKENPPCDNRGEEIMRRTRLKRELTLIWVTTDSVITNFSLLCLCRKVLLCGVKFTIVLTQSPFC